MNTIQLFVQFIFSRSVWHFPMRSFIIFMEQRGLAYCKPPAPQRGKTFLWLLRQNRLLTTEIRVKKEMTRDDNCARCDVLAKTALHAIRDCPYAAGIWKSLVSQNVWHSYFSSSLDDWLNGNLSNCYGFMVTYGGWQTLFSIVSWLIWKHKNEFVFKDACYSSAALIATSIAWTRSFNNTKSPKNFHSSAYTKSVWQTPSAGWLKLNTVGCFSPRKSYAAVGGVPKSRWSLITWLYNDIW